MTCDLYFYCFLCHKIEPVQNAKKNFKTGFNQIDDHRYPVGYCQKHMSSSNINSGTARC